MIPDEQWINFLTGPVRLYTCRSQTHTRALRNTSGRIRARARLFVCSHFKRGWRDVDTCTRRGDVWYPIAVPLYPANWNFSPRIEFFRENHETPCSRGIRDVLGVTLRGRIIHTQCDSSKHGYAADRISAPVWISRDVFPETKWKRERFIRTATIHCNRYRSSSHRCHQRGWVFQSLTS